MNARIIKTFFVVLAVTAAPALSARAGLEVLIKDGADQPGTLTVEVWQTGKSMKIPAPGAEVKVKSPQSSRDFTSDLMGRVTLPYTALVAEAKKAGQTEINLTVSASYRGETALALHSEPLATVEPLLLEASRREGEIGQRLADSGDLVSAEKHFIRAVELDPNSKAARFNLGLCREKMGKKRLAMADYTTYLAMGPSREDAIKVKKRVLALDRTMSPRMAVPQQEQDKLDAAKKRAIDGDLKGALKMCEDIQASCPWWEEPYYVAGVIAEKLMFLEDEAYLDVALTYLEIYDETGASRAMRRFNQSQKVTRLKTIKQKPEIYKAAKGGAKDETNEEPQAVDNPVRPHPSAQPDNGRGLDRRRRP